jgi:Secretion system C-terminal sorting domain
MMKWFCFTRYVLPLCFILPLSAQQHLQISPQNKKALIRKIVPAKNEPSTAVKIKLNNKAAQFGQWTRLKDWNEANSVVAESDSIAWVGTPVGLVRWNVKTNTYQTFDESNGLPFTAINSLAIDRAKQLWISTTQGIVKYFSGTFTSYNYENSNLPPASFTCLTVDSLNNVYVAYDAYVENNNFPDGGLAIFKGASWKYFSIHNSQGNFGPSAVCTYHDTVWIGEYDNIYTFSNDSAMGVPRWKDFGVYSMAVDFQDSLWVLSTDHKMLKYSQYKWKLIIDSVGFWQAIWNDPLVGLWFSGDRDTWQFPYGPFQLNFNDMHEGYKCSTDWLGIPGVCDFAGILGQFCSQYSISARSQFFASVGSANSQYQTSEGGLYTYDGFRWQVFRVPITLDENHIYGLGTDQNGEVYLSTPFYTQKTDGQNFQTVGGWVTGLRSWNNHFRVAPDGSIYTNHSQIYPNWDSYSGYVTGLDFDSFGNLWTSYPLMEYSWPGLSSTVITDSAIGYIDNPGYYVPQFMDVTTDKNDNVWAAAWYYGGAMFDRTKWHLLPPSDTTLPNFNYDLVFADSKNRIWFCTNQSSPNYGFTIFDGTNWRTYYSTENYAISYVYQIAEDHFGNIWLATGGGLLKYDGSSFTLFNSDNSPLASDFIVTAVAVDYSSNIWIGTLTGLYIFNPNGVQLGPYTYSSPVDSFSVVKSGNQAIAHFTPSAVASGAAKYELQRGRGAFKFWTVATSDWVSGNSSLVTEDSLPIIGNYYYRIKRIGADGRTSYSPSIAFSGAEKKVNLLDCKTYLSENRLYLEWKLQNEAFFYRFEVLRTDVLTGQSFITATLSINAPKNQEGYYYVSIDSLTQSSNKYSYTLSAIFTDSSRVILQTFAYVPQLPSSFSITQNYPNPFNGSTSLAVFMPVQGQVVFQFYDIIGREVMPSMRKDFAVGYNTIQLDLKSLASGFYLCIAKLGGERRIQKLLLIK